MDDLEALNEMVLFGQAVLFIYTCIYMLSKNTPGVRPSRKHHAVIASSDLSTRLKSKMSGGGQGPSSLLATV